MPQTRPRPSKASPRWQGEVANVAALPTTGNQVADVRVAKDTFIPWIWNGTAWQNLASPLGALNYKGVWDATNPPAGGNPTLADGVGTKGDYYVVSGAGIQDLGSGALDFNPADWVVYNGTIWEKADHTDVVTSVFTRQGAVVPAASDYDASQVDNDSSVVGATVKDALDTLGGAPAPAHAMGGAPHTADTLANVGGKLSDLGNDEVLTSTGAGALQGESKGTAFNKAFGSGAGTVCEGNDNRLSDVSCSANRNGDVSINDSVWTAVDLNAEEFDSASMHDNATNPSRITIPAGQAGKYSVLARVTFSGNATGVRGIGIYKDGVFQTNFFCNPVGVVETPIQVSKTFDLAAGEYLEMNVYQSSGAGLTIAGSASRTFLQVVKQRGA